MMKHPRPASLWVPMNLPEETEKHLLDEITRTYLEALNDGFAEGADAGVDVGVQAGIEAEAESQRKAKSGKARDMARKSIDARKGLGYTSEVFTDVYSAVIRAHFMASKLSADALSTDRSFGIRLHAAFVEHWEHSDILPRHSVRTRRRYITQARHKLGLI